MKHGRASGASWEDARAHVDADPVAPGKVTRVQRRARGEPVPADVAPADATPERAAGLGAIQRRALAHDLAAALGVTTVQLAGDPHTGLGDAEVHAAAAHGIAGAGQPLPHLDAIQRSFGRHDVTSVIAHVGGAAADAAAALGAHAYATGDHVAFAEAPSLHLAAHEAAHVVQQRAGVSLSSAVGHAGDAYEQQADAVADRVVRGESAEDLLGSGPVAAMSSGPAIQLDRKPAPRAAPLLTEERLPPIKPDAGWQPRAEPNLERDLRALSERGVIPLDESGNAQAACTAASVAVSSFQRQAGVLYVTYNELVGGLTRLIADPEAASELGEMNSWEGEGFESAIELALAQRVCEAHEPARTVRDVMDAEVDTRAEHRVVDRALHDEAGVQRAIEAMTGTERSIRTLMTRIPTRQSAIAAAAEALHQACLDVEILALQDELSNARSDMAKVQARKDSWVAGVSAAVKGLIVVVGGVSAGMGVGAAAATGAPVTAGAVAKGVGTFYAQGVATNAGNDLVTMGVEYFVGLTFREELKRAQARIDGAVGAIAAKEILKAGSVVREKQHVLDKELGELGTLTRELSDAHYAYQTAVNDVGRAVNRAGGRNEASREVAAMIRAVPIVERICGELQALLPGRAFVATRQFLDGAQQLLSVGKQAEEVLETYQLHKGLYGYVNASRERWAVRRDRLRAVLKSVTHTGAAHPSEAP